MRRAIRLITALILLLPASLPAADGVLIQGKTMGTTYHITVVAESEPATLRQQITQALDAVNRSMSTYRKESEISRFNQLDAPGKPFPVTPGFLSVMTTAQQIYRLTEGAWDGTVDPLVNLWGFGRKGVRTSVPDAAAIRSALEQVGFRQIGIDPSGYLTKSHSAVTLDLASIAKGYGVDVVSEVIRKAGIPRFLVEIGGEIYAAGLRPDNTPWRVGINRPEIDAAFDAVYKVVALSDKAFATSGDYRNFFIQDGRRYAHVIDPRTGYPVANGVVSATVIADSCTFADGLATALMVMGVQEGLKLVERLAGVECLLITENHDGALVDHPSTGFRSLPR